ncbi:hypothetical protein BT69DRAFT_1317338 [Atractiella rhizophila]|nr:hypothetical protein BT69DRAFT_1317338 [Atractiella rhizophila]
MSLSEALCRQGLIFLTSGVALGPAVILAPIPRLALSAHLHCLLEGTMVLALGNYLSPTREARLSPQEKRLIFWGIIATWPAILTEVANGWWGTTGTLPIAARQAGIFARAALWKEAIVYVTHAGDAVGALISLGILCRRLL